MSTIPFTQYLRPNGRREAVTIDRPDHIAKAADNIREHGFRFECEVLMDGTASFTISDDDGDYAIETCPNGPQVPATVDALICNFDLARAIKQRGF